MNINKDINNSLELQYNESAKNTKKEKIEKLNIIKDLEGDKCGKEKNKVYFSNHESNNSNNIDNNLNNKNIRKKIFYNNENMCSR